VYYLTVASADNWSGAVCNLGRYLMPVAPLALALLGLALALRPGSLVRHPWLFGLLLATLPWLHQKFLPVWLALVATASWVAWRERTAGSGRGWAAGLLLPTALSLYLTALYNFAITGSVRPDALFLAWGPAGVTSARVGQGVLGLLLDARYGILPYVPVLALAAAGLVLGGARTFAVVMPAAAVYYLTVASADNWAGAVCNLGRYFMPVAPLAVALVAVAVDAVTRPGARHRRGAVALVLVLAAWSALFAVALWRDPHAANDSALLLAKSTYADGNQYVPNLFIRRWAEGAPGLWARIAAWAAALVAIAAWWLRVAARSSGAGRGRSPLATLAAVAGVVLAAGLVLERWPGTRTAPSFPGRLAVGGAGPALFLDGAASVREGEAIVGPGRVGVLLRSAEVAPGLTVTIGGQDGVLRAPGLPPLALRPAGALVSLPLLPYHVVRGRDGRTVAFSRTSLELEGQAVFRPEMEPEGTGVR
jgi:hypothetical protein